MTTQDNIDERIAASETRVVKVIFPFRTNHHDTLFGGQALSWMDETCFIAATRFSRKTMVTASSDNIKFTKAIPADSLIELVAKVTKVGRSSLVVHVDVFIESMYEDGKEKAIEGDFTLVALNDQQEAIPVLD